jgi:hypothetical protein
MIKVQFTGNNPNMFQVDRSYNQPGITGAVQWNGNSKCLEVSTGDTWHRIDNTVEFSVSNSTPDLWAMYYWIEEQKKEKEKEKEMRSKYPALDEAYNHLELIKALVETGPEQETEVQSSP